MKFFVSLALFAAGAIAQTSTPVPTSGSGNDDGCLANYIVTRCLQTEQPKAAACNQTDYKCLCAAYEAIATCFNNCPDDTRAASAQAQVSSFCAHVTTSKLTSTGTSSMSSSTATIPTTSDSTMTSGGQNTQTFSAGSPTQTDGAGSLIQNTGGMLLAAGAVVAML